MTSGRTYAPQPTLWETAADVADKTDRYNHPVHVHSVIAVFPTYGDAMKQQQTEREDMHLTSWGSGSMLGRRTLAIVADRGDFLEAWAYKPTSHETAVNRELRMRHEWLVYSLMCRLVPGGRIVLV